MHPPRTVLGRGLKQDNRKFVSPRGKFSSASDLVTGPYGIHREKLAYGIFARALLEAIGQHQDACFFVVRCLTEPDLPASGGAFAPVTVTAPERCLVNARPPAAVVAGNTETSSRIVDLAFAALGELVPAPAQGQGTMNNLAFGSDRFTYYETVGGGQGACPGADGPSGVHVAMSNTFATPAEAIELEYPLQVERWELRHGSGGTGTHRGGDGVVRELRALEDCRLSVLAERRRHAPQGREGGEEGARGRTLVNGEEQPPKVTRRLRAGDLVRVETPGGGGYGSRG